LRLTHRFRAPNTACRAPSRGAARSQQGAEWHRKLHDSRPVGNGLAVGYL